MGKAYLQFFRPAHIRDAVKTYVVESGDVAQINKLIPGSATVVEGKVIFTGKSNQVAELRLRHKMKLSEV